MQAAAQDKPASGDRFRRCGHTARQRRPIRGALERLLRASVSAAKVWSDAAGATAGCCHRISNTTEPLPIMSDHYVILANRGHLKIFRQRKSPEQMAVDIDEVQALDFPAGVKSYTDSDEDFAGRFQSSKQQAAGPGAPQARTGMSIDERLPMKNEMQRRETADVAQAIEAFLGTVQDATWDFAAGPENHNALLETLSPSARQRMRQSVTKDLVHQGRDAVKQAFGL